MDIQIHYICKAAVALGNFAYDLATTCEHSKNSRRQHSYAPPNNARGYTIY